MGCRDLQRAGRSELQLASSLALLAYCEDPVVQGACGVLSCWEKPLTEWQSFEIWCGNNFGALRIKKEKVMNRLQTISRYCWTWTNLLVKSFFFFFIVLFCFVAGQRAAADSEAAWDGAKILRPSFVMTLFFVILKKTEERKSLFSFSGAKNLSLRSDFCSAVPRLMKDPALNGSPSNHPYHLHHLLSLNASK